MAPVIKTGCEKAISLLTRRKKNMGMGARIPLAADMRDNNTALEDKLPQSSSLVVTTEFHQKPSGPVLSANHLGNINNYGHMWKKCGHV